MTNKISVTNYKNGGTGTYQVNNSNLIVCVKPVHSFYKNYIELIEFIEINKILGVSKFMIYNETMSPEVSCVLNYYKGHENILTILPWELMEPLEKGEIQNRGCLAALNDCIYRNMNDFGYLMQIDLDEFIIPHIHESIPDMLEYLVLNKIKGEKLGKWQNLIMQENQKKLANPNVTTSFNFQNAFFCLQFGNIFMPPL